MGGRGSPGKTKGAGSATAKPRTKTSTNKYAFNGAKVVYKGRQAEVTGINGKRVTMKDSNTGKRFSASRSDYDKSFK